MISNNTPLLDASFSAPPLRPAAPSLTPNRAQAEFSFRPFVLPLIVTGVALLALASLPLIFMAPGAVLGSVGCFIMISCSFGVGPVALIMGIAFAILPNEAFEAFFPESPS